MHFGFQLLRTVNFKLWKHKSVFTWKIIQIILLTRSRCHCGKVYWNPRRKCVLSALWSQWLMVLKNAAIVIQPPLACINRDNARVGLSWGSSVSARPAYLFWQAVRSSGVGVPFLPCAVPWTNRNTGALLRSLCCVPTCKQKEIEKKVTHGTKQRNKAWHLIFSYLKSIPVETTLGLFYVETASSCFFFWRATCLLCE